MNKKALTVKQLQKNVTALSEEDVLPPELMAVLEEKMPQWVKEYEADGTAVVRWTFEWALMLEYLLQAEFGFSDDELDRLNKKIKQLIPLLPKMKMEIPRLLSKEDFQFANEMVSRNKHLYKAQKAGIVLPDKSELKKLK